MEQAEQPLAVPPVTAPRDLSGRVLLLIGATGGLGTAVALAAATAGAQLILAGRQVVKLEKLADAAEAAGAPVPILYPVDLSGAKAADYDQMAAAIGTEFGGLDAVIHVAARFDGLTPLAHLGEDRWGETQRINVEARFLIDQATFTLLRERHGRVLHAVDSLDRVRQAYWGAYAVSQCALRGLIAVEASEFEDEKVTVAAMLPPPMRTRLRAAAYVSEEVGQAVAPEAVAPQVLSLLDPALTLAPAATYALAGS